MLEIVVAITITITITQYHEASLLSLLRCCTSYINSWKCNIY